MFVEFVLSSRRFTLAAILAGLLAAAQLPARAEAGGLQNADYKDCIRQIGYAYAECSNSSAGSKCEKAEKRAIDRCLGVDKGSGKERGTDKGGGKERGSDKGKQK
jgi:hypothetical protein